jgi:hypothetical protein
MSVARGWALWAVWVQNFCKIGSDGHTMGSECRWTCWKFCRTILRSFGGGLSTGNI